MGEEREKRREGGEKGRKEREGGEKKRKEREERGEEKRGKEREEGDGGEEGERKKRGGKDKGKGKSTKDKTNSRPFTRILSWASWSHKQQTIRLKTRLLREVRFSAHPSHVFWLPFSIPFSQGTGKPPALGLQRFNL